MAQLVGRAPAAGEDARRWGFNLCGPLLGGMESWVGRPDLSRSIVAASFWTVVAWMLHLILGKNREQREKCELLLNLIS